MSSFVCAYASPDRSFIFPKLSKVCEHLPFFGEHEGKSYCVLHYPLEDKKEEFNQVLKQKIDKSDFNLCGVWFPETVDFTGFTFETEVDLYESFFYKTPLFNRVVFHKSVNFSSATFNENCVFINSRFNDSTSFLRLTVNGNANFTHSYFKEKTYFSNSRFCSVAEFPRTYFAHSVSFTDASMLGKADFAGSTFEEDAVFSRVKFSNEAEFRYSEFLSNAYFKQCIFESAVSFHYINFFKIFDLSSSIFKDNFEFSGLELFNSQIFGAFDNNFWLDLQFAKIEKPEKTSFHSVPLRPSWFVNIDSRKFVFTDVDWLNANGNRQNVVNELDNLKRRNVLNSHRRLLTKTYRQLATNAEENNRFEEASNFRRMAFETEWLEKKEKFLNSIDKLPDEHEKLKRRFGGSTSKEDLPIPPTNSFAIARLFDLLHLLYRITSYYGESRQRAFGVLLIILIVSAFLYTQFNFNVCLPNQACEIRTLSLFEAITHSISTAILQNPETRKPLGYSELIVTLEKIFAPLQAALLALAIRRKFMR